MSKFGLFRTRMNNEASCRQKFETRFITEGAAPIIIHILRLDKDREATMVFTDTEGPDTAIVFTPKQQNHYDDLLKMDYYTWDDKTFFVYEDVLIAREVSYIKQKAYQCNVTVRLLHDQCMYYSTNECKGYFISSLRSYVDTEFQQKINITDKEHPVLVIPRQEWVANGMVIDIEGKPWKIINYDAITNPGIVYISLERDFFKKGNDLIEMPIENILKAGIIYTFNTQDGYFNSSSPLLIKSKTSTEVKFEIPYGISEIEIEIKDKQEMIKQTYKVVV